MPHFSPVLQLDHHMAGDGVVLKGVHGEILAVTRGFEAAMRHLAHQHEMRVDPGATIMEPGGRRHSFADVGGPHRRGETIVAVVGPRYRLIDVVEARDRYDRSEYLLADDLVLLERARDDGRLEEEALASGRLAA